MRVLFDQATPVPLRQFLQGHMVRTAAQEKWHRLRNGELLNVAEAAGFDVLVTADKNMRYQQNLTAAESPLSSWASNNGPNSGDMCSLLPPL
jgi:predicted nuclease of predicted toxin-antitoxin system